MTDPSQPLDGEVWASLTTKGFKNFLFAKIMPFFGPVLDVMHGIGELHRPARLTR